MHMQGIGGPGGPAGGVSGINVSPNVRWDAVSETIEAHPREVADYVKKNWVILMWYMARDDIHETHYENGYQLSRVRSEYRPVVLLGRTNLDTIREQNQALTIQNKNLIDRTKSLEELQKAHEELKKRASDLEVTASQAETRATESSRLRYELEEQKRKLEISIGKIRSAIGELKMKEILGV